MNKIDRIKDVLSSYITGEDGNDMTIDEIIDDMLENPPDYKFMRGDIIDIIKILLED